MMKADIRWLDNPEIFRVNREDAHSDHAYYASYNDMEKKSDRWVMLLDGLWKFTVKQHPLGGKKAQTSPSKCLACFKLV